ncbi:MAG TPA: cupin domain-containing protein [Acidimicrobiia bacterium]|nr:cupin domain-containing protein [Acidimicrobiia bacterium]
MGAYLDVDAGAFQSAFAQRSIAFRHALADHPLLDLGSIAELADRLAPDQVRRERSDLPLDDRGYVDVGDGSASTSVLGIARNGFRISLREIQDDRRFAPLIADCHAELAKLLGDREGGVARPAAYIFVTAAGGTTPMHFDGEHSFLLQVRGTKSTHTVPRAGAGTDVQRELDRYYDGRDCSFDRMRATADGFELGPGDAVYFPSFLPHWVTTGAEPSVSFSLPFYTRFSRRAEDVNRLNRHLRRIGLSPRPPGASEPVDAAKVALLRSVRALKDSVRHARAREAAT